LIRFDRNVLIMWFGSIPRTLRGLRLLFQILHSFSAFARVLFRWSCFDGGAPRYNLPGPSGHILAEAARRGVVVGGEVRLGRAGLNCPEARPTSRHEIRRHMADQRSDRELADLIIRVGDEEAFRALYRRHSPKIFQFVLRLLGGDVAEAEDVMQETWLRAARALGAFRWESAFSSWMSGIALNRVRELARKKRRSLVEVEGDWEVAVSPSDAGRRIDLERALALLPPGFRTVLVLHDVEGFTHQEIGERLGITDGTSKSQLHGARRAMRRIMSLEAETA